MKLTSFKLYIEDYFGAKKKTPRTVPDTCRGRVSNYNSKLEHIKNGTEFGWSSNTTVENLHLQVDRVERARHSLPSLFILAHRTSRGGGGRAA